jgi:dephospho-CoA kinase
MKKIGLTGGIGSGKSTVAKLFEELGVSVYYSDDRAKELMNSNKTIISNILKNFGKEAYVNGKLNTKYLALKVFNNKKKLTCLESIVHPIVKKDFIKWVKKQTSEYVIMENAILYKSEMYKLVDEIIFIQSLEDIRLKRVIYRDGVSEFDVKQRMLNQEKLDFMLKKSKYIIVNDFSIDLLKEKVKNINSDVKKVLKKR